MLTSRSQSLLAAVCLIWFGLTNTLFAGGIVVCRDGHGGTRIEWGCSRNTDGECATTCGTVWASAGSFWAVTMTGGN